MWFLTTARDLDGRAHSCLHTSQPGARCVKEFQRPGSVAGGLQEYRHGIICSRMYFIRVCQWPDKNEHELQRESIPARCRPQHTTQVQVSVFMHALSTKRDISAFSCSGIQIYVVLRYLNFFNCADRFLQFCTELHYKVWHHWPGSSHAHTHTHTRLYTRHKHMSRWHVCGKHPAMWTHVSHFLGSRVHTYTDSLCVSLRYRHLRRQWRTRLVIPVTELSHKKHSCCRI